VGRSPSPGSSGGSTEYLQSHADHIQTQVRRIRTREGQNGNLHQKHVTTHPWCVLCVACLAYIWAAAMGARNTNSVHHSFTNQSVQFPRPRQSLPSRMRGDSSALSTPSHPSETAACRLPSFLPVRATRTAVIAAPAARKATVQGGWRAARHLQQHGA